MTDLQHFPIVGASACVWRGDRVLLIKRAKPPLIWALPGGHVEAGEPVLAAAHRELLEETGVKADLPHLLGVYDIIRRTDGGTLEAHFVLACYGGTWTGGDAKASGDAAQARWMSRAELAGLSLPDTVTDAIGRMAQILKL